MNEQLIENDNADEILPKLQNWVRANRLVVSGILGGIAMLALGGFLIKGGFFEDAKVEVVEPSSSAVVSGKVTVEISGAVQKPGVYEVLASDRVERLLIAAGGLSADADREWVGKSLNRAAKLVDGQKIYIPSKGETVLSGSTIGSTRASGIINLNTASLGELDSLPGIGAARAQAIVQNRPYSSVEELASKKILPQSVFEKIKDRVQAQ